MSIDLKNITSNFSTDIINDNFRKLEEYINDNLLNRDGIEAGEANQMELPLDMNSHPILNAVTDAGNPRSLLAVEEGDSRYVNKSGDTMQGPLYMGNNPLHVRSPVFDNEPAQKGQLDREIVQGREADEAIIRGYKAADQALARSIEAIPIIQEGDLSRIGDAQVTTNTGTQALTQALDQRVSYVDTIADLQALDTSVLVDGQQVQVKEYHANTGVGGGEFYWDATSTEDENGGTVFEVVGEAIGRFVRRFDGAAHVTWFGAIGDGVTENQEIPIQKAIDAIRDVYIPAGTYMLNSTIYLKSGTTLFGEKSSVLKHHPSFYDTFWGALGIDDEDVRDVTVKGITLDGNRKNLPNYDPVTDLNSDGSSAPLIRIRGLGPSKYSANIHITDVSFIQGPLDSIYIRAQYIEDINVSGCYSYDCGRTHFVVTRGENIIFDRNICIDAKNSVFDIESNYDYDVVRNVTLSNNLLLSRSSDATGIGLTGPGTHEDIVISNNTIKTEGSVIGFGDCSNLIFSGNVCSGVNNVPARGVVQTLGGAKDTLITGNKVTTRSALDEGETARGLWIREPENITISDNIFDFEAGGVTVDRGGFGVRIVGNRITSPSQSLAVFAAEGAVISDNELKSGGSSTVGLLLDNPDLIFSGNSVHVGGSQVWLYSSDGIYTNNSFSGASVIRVMDAGVSSSLIGNRMRLQRFESRNISNLILKDNEMRFENNASENMVSIFSDTLYADVTGNLIYAEESTTTTGYGVNMLAERFTFTGNSVIDLKTTKTVGAALRVAGAALLGTIQGNTFDTAAPPTLLSGIDIKPFIPEKTRAENLSIFNHLL